MRALLVLPSELTASASLAKAVAAGGWIRSGELAGFAVFVHRAAPPYAVTGSGATVSVLASDPWTGSATVTVHTPWAAELIRSVAAVPGWRATVAHDGAAAQVPVRRNGLVQSVAVPAGTSTISFAYAAPGWQPAQLIALAGLLGVAGLLLAPAAARLRRRRFNGAGSRSPERV